MPYRFLRPLSPAPVSRSLRIALFTGNYVHIEDGVSRTLGRLVGYLIAQGHEVLVLGPTVENPSVEQPGRFLAAPSVPIPGRAEYRFTTGFPADLRALVEAFAPDIVHLATPDVLGHRALTWARKNSIPAVATYHTHFLAYADYYGLGIARPLLRFIARYFYNRCREVYVPTREMERSLREQGVTATIKLWPRGIELDRFSPSHRSESWRTAQGFEPTDVVISFVSRLVKEKGPDLFAEVVQRLQRGGFPVRALIVGDGPEREALAETLPRASFTGHIGGHMLATAYASSDVFLFPSETETFGNVTLEAMASGLAPVCADAAGSRSLIDDGRTGILCPPRDVDAFTDATRRLVQDAELRHVLGHAGRDEAREYSWSFVLSRIVTYYCEVLPQAADVSCDIITTV